MSGKLLEKYVATKCLRPLEIMPWPTGGVMSHIIAREGTGKFVREKKNYIFKTTSTLVIYFKNL